MPLISPKFIYIRLTHGSVVIIPLNARQDGRDIIRRTPAVLQNIQTKLARSVDIRMEHLADEFNARWLIWVLLLEMHHQAECTILERRFCGADDHSVPNIIVL